MHVLLKCSLDASLLSTIGLFLTMVHHPALSFLWDHSPRTFLRDGSVKTIELQKGALLLSVTYSII
jgi:hypothetical protein